MGNGGYITDSNGDVKKLIWKLLDIIVGILVLIMSGATSYTVKNIIDLREKVAAIEASRFTATDGLEMWRVLEAKVNRSDVPTAETLRRLDTIEKKLDNHIERDR